MLAGLPEGRSIHSRRLLALVRDRLWAGCVVHSDLRETTLVGTTDGRKRTAQIEPVPLSVQGPDPSVAVRADVVIGNCTSRGIDGNESRSTYATGRSSDVKGFARTT